MNVRNNLVELLIFALISTFISQVMVDLSDVVLVSTALYLAFKSKEIKLFINGFKPPFFWLIWLAVVFFGLVINLGFSDWQVWTNFLEFRWIFSLLSVIYLARKVEDQSQFLKKLMYPILIMNVLSLLLNLREDEGRVSGVINAVMAFSHNIAPIFCLFSVLFFVNWKNLNQKERILVGAVAFTSGLLTLLTMTRGVWIGSAVAILVGIFVWNVKNGIKIFSVLAVFAGITFFASERVQDRVFSKTKEEATSNNVRRALWKANWRMVQDYPVLGVGFGQNKSHLRKYYDELGYPADMFLSHAHNQYLQFWAGTGTLGFLCYLVFLFLIFKKVWCGYSRSPLENRSLLLGLGSALLCFAVGAVTEASFNISKNRFLFLLLAGVAIGFSETAKALEKKAES